MSATRNSGKAVHTVEELLAHALAMEEEAAQRYVELADQMAVHNNHEVETLFRKLAEIEKKHVDHMSEASAGLALPRIAPWDYRWGDGESPEALDPADLHYLIRPYQAIALALEHERRAADFYSELAAGARRADVRKLAEQFADEEREHVGWLEKWLERYPKPDADWDDDPDPPNALE